MRGVVLVVVSVVGLVYADEFEDLCGEARAAVVKKDVETAAKLLDRIGSHNTPDAAKFLLKLASKAVKEPEIFDALVGALANLTNEAAQKEVVKAVLAGGRDTRLAAIEACANYNTDDANNALYKALTDSNDLVAISATRALANTYDKAAIEPMIKALELAQRRKRQRLITELCLGLERITGLEGGPQTAADWKAWWSANKDKPLPRETRPSEGTVTPSPFVRRFKTSVFGLPVRSKRIIFIIDVSGSMKQADPPPKQWKEEVEKQLKTIADNKEREKKRKEVENEMKNWGKERQRIYRVKKELTRCIRNMPNDVKFNIIAFSDQITKWRPGLTRATENAKKKAIAWVQKLEADGLTYTDEAIEEAFKDRQVNTIILLTDGAPTHIGGDAKPEWGGHEDSKALIAQILAWVRKHNRLRKVTIHCLGFEEANFEFLKRLAHENNGTCKAIR